MAERPGGGFEVEKPGEPGADIVARTRQLYDYYSQLLVLIRGLGGPENMSLQARAGAVRERVEGKGGEKFELINDLWQKATLTNEEKEKLVSFGDELDRENEALEGIYKEMRGDEGALGRIRPTAPSPSPEPPPADTTTTEAPIPAPLVLRSQSVPQVKCLLRLQ